MVGQPQKYTTPRGESSQQAHSHIIAESGGRNSEIDLSGLEALIRKTPIGSRRFRELFMERARLRQIASSRNASPRPEGKN